MTYIPDTRDPIEKRPFAKEEEPNAYYEGLMDEDSSWLMKHYDFGVADCINCFDNADAFSFDNAFESLEESERTINEKQLEFLKSKNVIDFLKYAVLYHVECQRDDSVIAKIENMDQTEYVIRFNQFKADFENLSREEFEKKYQRREFNEYGCYDNEIPPHTLIVIDSKKAADLRFKHEYEELNTRSLKLASMLNNWDHLNFTPVCPKTMLEAQLKAMNEYKRILEERAILENVDLGGDGK